MHLRLPISLNVSGMRAVVIGGGGVAERKVMTLLDCGARVRVVCPQPTQQIRRLADAGKIELVQDSYQSAYLSDAQLVFACTDSRDVNAQVTRDARALGIWINVADDPELCTFTMPAILRRGCVTIAVDTSGSSPALARVLRDRLSEWIGSEYAQLSELLLEMREELKAQIREPARRTAMVRDALNKGVLELLRAGKYDEARELLQQCVRRWSQATATPHEQEGV